uniref:Si:ch73-233k15.2 n=1 Tax=Pundamilia nyererei TaxID=303518 RepID=A0A3B4FRB3_9CICH
MKIVNDQNRLQHMLDHINQTEKIRNKALCYSKDTLTLVEKVYKFCEGFSEWKNEREEEIKTMLDIKNRAEKLNMTFSHVTQSEEKGEAFLEFMNSKLPKMTENSRYGELEKELEKVITKTLESLENLSCFLDAVARLAVTSLQVFTEKQLFHLPEEINLEYVQIFIAAARLFCPLLLVFKTEAKVFFIPKIQNVEVLADQLDRYIQTAEKFCECLGKSFIRKSYFRMKIVDDQKMFQHLLDEVNHLDEIREVCCSRFIEEFNKRKSEMLEFLNELQGCAVQLEKMNKGAKISSVAGSSVGAVGGALSIAGLALAPLTAGVSLALTMTGVGLGVTSAVNSAVTTGTEIGVNNTQKKRANEILQNFMKGIQSFHDCLEGVASQPVSNVKVSKSEVVIGVTKIATKAGTFGKGIDSFVDAASAVKMLQSEEQIITSAGRVLAQEGKTLRNVPRVASDVPEMGIGTAQAAVKGPLALSKTMRGLFIAGNAIFIGMDLFFICKDSVSLAKGNNTEVSELIKARAELWRLEFDSWQKIHDSLDEGLRTLQGGKKQDPGYAGQRSSSPEKNK